MGPVETGGGWGVLLCYTAMAVQGVGTDKTRHRENAGGPSSGWFTDQVRVKGGRGHSHSRSGLRKSGRG